MTYGFGRKRRLIGSLGVLALSFVIGVSGCTLETGLESATCEKEGVVSEDGTRRCEQGYWVQLGDASGMNPDGGPSGNEPGEPCTSDAQCRSGVCEKEKCAEPTCEDETRNGGESDIDCGTETCGLCENGDRCVENDNCESGTCNGGRCTEASCSDGIENGDETDKDCGGLKCMKRCPAGKKCIEHRDCQSGRCNESSKLCASASCNDGIENGTETDVDCGGPNCKACKLQQVCASNDDCSCGGAKGCENAICKEKQGGGGIKICQSVACSDGKLNGEETATDCGGAQCPGCSAGEPCNMDRDCASNKCGMDNKCEEPTCDDMTQNQDESDTDCGGGTCDKCKPGRSCNSPSDCQSGICKTDNTCAQPSCMDQTKNGEETETDCGGSTCPGCAIGQDCDDDGDCKSDKCSGGKCVRSCKDGTKNGNESDVDCGGECKPCVAGKSCNGNRDCESSWCKRSTCKVRIVGKLDDKHPGKWSDGTLASSCEEYSSPSGHYEFNVKGKSATETNGIYRIKTSSGTYNVYCEMLIPTGGWTLVLVSANDGTDTWTWDNRNYLQPGSKSTIGSLKHLEKDFKSEAYDDLEFEDLLFIHQGSGEWIKYTGVGSGNKTIAKFIQDEGRSCYARGGNKYSAAGMSSGLSASSSDLCSTDLYFSPKDQDGSNSCSGNNATSHAYGPTWSGDSGSGCPMDDPGSSTSIGPNANNTGSESTSCGFGREAGLSGNKAIQMFVR